MNALFRQFFILLLLVAFSQLMCYLVYHLTNSGVYHSQLMHNSESEKLQAARKKRQQNMRNRIDKVRKSCMRHKLSLRSIHRSFFGEQDTDGALMTNRDILVSRQEKLAWCKVPKVASTTMVQSLLHALGRGDLVTRLQRSKQHAALRRIMPHVRAGDDLEEYTNFMLVRHPFDRILSAYRDKIINKEDEDAPHMFRKFRSKYSLPIIRKYRRTSPATTFYRDVPTFPEFVDYLIDTPVWLFNEHWRPYYLICTPCHYHYKIILKLETLLEDAMALVEMSSFPDLSPNMTHITVTRVNEKKMFENASYNATEQTAFYYSQLSQETVRKLYEVYIIDFEMFGYEVTPYHK